jgi:hypothetical protein
MSTKINLVIDQGASFSANVTPIYANGTAINLVGANAAGQIRRWYTSSNSTSFDITVDSLGGKLTLSLDPTVTAGLDSGRYVYDVNLTDSSNTVIRVCEGIATVTPGVTH